MLPDDPRAKQLIHLVRQIFLEFSAHADRLKAIRDRVPSDLQEYAIRLLRSIEENAARSSYEADPFTSTESREGTHDYWKPVASDDPFIGYRPIPPAISEGTYANVWLCSSRFGKRTAVVKFISRQHAPASHMRLSQTLAQSQALFGFSHPNVIRIYASGMLRGPEPYLCPYISMEHVEGKTLKEWLPDRIAQLATESRASRDPQGLPEREAASIVAILCDAVQACHDHDVFHMDLSFNNVMVADSEANTANAKTLKIIDFGDAAINLVDMGGTTPGFSDLAYRTADDHIPGAADDIFSLGCLLYYLATGATPTIGPKGMPVDTSSIKDPILRKLVARSLARRGQEESAQNPVNGDVLQIHGDSSPHYDSVREFGEELRAWASDYPVARIAIDYTWSKRLSLLLKRCREHDRVEDHSRIAAYGGIAMAAGSFTAPIANHVLIARGMDVATAARTTGNRYIAWLLAVSGVVAALTIDRRGKVPALSKTAVFLFMTMLAYVVAFMILMMVLCDGDAAKGGGFQFLMTSLLTVYLGMRKPEWRAWTWLGWCFLVLSVPAGWASKQPWYPPYYPLIQDLQQGVLFVTFSAAALWHGELLSEPTPQQIEPSRQREIST